MSKISNILTMLQLLSNGRKYSTKELANKLETSERMIRIYKDDLEKAGIFIDTIMGPYGGYVLNQEINIQNSRKTDLNLSLEDQNKYNYLTRAIKEKRKVKILYYTKDKGDYERIIHPAEMFLYKDGWYCAAYCELRKDMRQFNIKDIKELELLNEIF